MRVALTAGGTGGHILPALAVYDALRERVSGVEVRWFGTEDRGERARIEARGIPFVAVPSAAMRGKGMTARASGALRLGKGVLRALRELRRFRPDVVFSTGGYGSFPAALAAKLRRTPVVVYLPDVTPGWAVRAETRLATKLATTTDAALGHLPRAKTTVTGYPVRPEFFSQTKEEARRALGIAPDEKMVLVAGASQGSKSINAAVFRALRTLVEEVTLVHVTGTEDYDEAAGFSATALGALSARYRPAAFREDLPAVMVAADLAVMRAGASVLGEVPAAGVPAILVPGAFAGGHQYDNARWLEQGGAAVILEEKDLGSLAPAVLGLLEDGDRLAAMRDASRSLARPGAADAIAQILEEVARR